MSRRLDGGSPGAEVAALPAPERGSAVTDGLSEIVLPDDPSFGPEVQVDYPGYRSTRWRAPDRPLVTLPEELHSLAGPVFGEDAVQPTDADLTRQHEGEPLGERIVVHGRVLDDGRAPAPRRAGRDLAGQRLRPLSPPGRPAPGAARPELLRRRPLPHRRRRPLRVRHDQARRVPVGQPRECVAAGAHPLLALRPALHAAAGDADVLPGRSAVPVRPDLQLGPRPEVACAARLALRPRRDRSRLGARLRVGRRARTWRRATRHRSRATHDDSVADRRPLLLDRPGRRRPDAERARSPTGSRSRDSSSTARASRSSTA